MALGRDHAEKAHVALQRFGLGGRRDQWQTIAADPAAAIEAELAAFASAATAPAALPTTQSALVAHFDNLNAERIARESSRDDQRELRVAAARSAAAQVQPGSVMAGAGMMGNSMAEPMMGGMMGGKMSPAPGTMAGGAAGPGPAAQAPVPVEQKIFRDETMARMRRGLDADIGLTERLTLFWSNHFCVSVQKGQITRVTAGAMEREAVRPHVLGRFETMLLAVAKHPAMLFYLDNRQSVGPESPAGRSRRVGLNENLAREILELHTLGVDGGYGQADVTALARIITGWTFVGPNERVGETGAFAFVPNRHQPGDHSLLGKVYKAGGVEQGEAALRDLARHPSTARHLARKMVRHFIADEPPADLVSHLAKAYLDSGGDLGEMTRALVRHPSAWQAPLTKLRSPYEFLLATARAIVPPQEFGQIVGPLNALGQPLWAPPGPNGFPDTFAHWANPEGMRARLDIAASIGRRAGGLDARDIAERLFGPMQSTETRQAIQRAESKPQGLAILLMSPEFQRR
jgi:uncharacterized protein (DUF1800 family)